MVIGLERGADLHMVQLMPLPLTVSCSCKIPDWFYLSGTGSTGSPGKRAVKPACVCVCVCVPGNVINGRAHDAPRPAKQLQYPLSLVRSFLLLGTMDHGPSILGGPGPASPLIFCRGGPIRYRTITLPFPSFPLFSLPFSYPSFPLRNVTSAVWQVTLCDPM